MPYKDGRPVFFSLPSVGYQDNSAADYLTTWVDEKLVHIATLMENLHTKLDPETTDDIWLDYLAFLVGLSGAYWDTKWSSGVKRQMIAQAHSLWGRRGTLKAIQQVLDTHSLTYSIWTNGSLRLAFGLPTTFGRDDLRLYVRLPLVFQRTSNEFKEAARALRNYSPAIIKSAVVFERFYLGFSVLGDPVFSS